DARAVRDLDRSLVARAPIAEDLPLHGHRDRRGRGTRRRRGRRGAGGASRERTRDALEPAVRRRRDGTRGGDLESEHRRSARLDRAVPTQVANRVVRRGNAGLAIPQRDELAAEIELDLPARDRRRAGVLELDLADEARPPVARDREVDRDGL